MSAAAVALAGILLLVVPCWAHARDYAGTTVHVVFSNHLDVGFTQLDNETLNAYFHDHIPRAIWLAEWLKLSGSNDSFIWTTHPWLLSLYLNCPDQLGVVCPSSQQQDAVRTAIKQGVITWHAAPFNLQWEMLPAPAPHTPPPQAARSIDSPPNRVRKLQASRPPSRRQHQGPAGGAQQTTLDPNSMFAATLDISRRLDRELGVTPKTVVSLRDVPGLTRSAVPHLVAADIKAITVGVNGGSAPPAVPLNNPFLWRDNSTDTQLLAMWHAGGYGGQCRDATAAPDEPELQVGCHDECVSAPGLNHVMCFSWRSDNQGPAQDTLEIAAVMRTVRQQWPGATVQISTLEVFVKQLAKAVEEGSVELPVVTGEIGDTWVYGVSSDPLKISRYRAAARARRRACEEEQACGDLQQSGALARFDLLLLKVPEHTWGLDVKSTLSYFNSNYSNTHLHSCMTQVSGSNDVATAFSTHGSTTGPVRSRVSSDFHGDLSADAPGCGGTSRLIHSWIRQAAYVDWSLQELPCDHVLLQHYTSDMKDMASLGQMATKPQGQSVLPENGPQMQEFASHAWLIGVDTKTGFITKLCRTNSSNSGRPHCSSTDWADGRDSLFAVPLYVVHKASDYNIIWNEYAWEGPPHLNPWFMMDFGKTGLSNTWDKHIEALPKFKMLYHTNTPDSGLTLQLHYTLPHNLHTQAGAPSSLVTIIQSAPGDTSLRLSLVWLDKTPTRLPESLWLRFKLQDGVAVDADRWTLHKLGQAVSPHEVILNGSQSMHAVDDITGVSVAAAVQEQLLPNAGTDVPRDVLHVTPLDSPLVSPGQPMTLPNVRHQPDMRQGMAFNLHNNMWGTNYVMWLPYQTTQSAGASHHILWPNHCNRDSSMGSQFDADVLSRLADQRTSVFRFKLDVVGSSDEMRPPTA